MHYLVSDLKCYSTPFIPGNEVNCTICWKKGYFLVQYVENWPLQQLEHYCLQDGTECWTECNNTVDSFTTIPNEEKMCMNSTYTKVLNSFEIKWLPVSIEQDLINCNEKWLICKPYCVGCLNVTRINSNGPELVQAGCVGEESLNKTIDSLNPQIDFPEMNQCTYKPGRHLSDAAGSGYIKLCICNTTGCNQKPFVATTVANSASHSIFKDKNMNTLYFQFSNMFLVLLRNNFQQR